MALSNEAQQRKNVIVRMMQSTALRNGKRCDLQHMFRVADKLHRPGMVERR